MGFEHFPSSSSVPPPLPMSSQGESVIVVIDANRSRGSVEALDWALKHVVRPKDTVLVLGVMYEFGMKPSLGKKPSCFPFHMGISISGIWESIEFSISGHNEKKPRAIEVEIEKIREQYQCSLQPFYRRCKKNEVKLEVKLAAGYEPRIITVEEALNINTRWIVLDSHLKKDKVFIYGHVGCNVAVMKRKDGATLMPSKINPPGRRPVPAPEPTPEPAPQTPCWYPISWRTGFPRSFTQTELEEITNRFAVENVVQDDMEMKVFKGSLQGNPVLVKCFSADDERFWTMIKILSRVRHRNIMNLVGYCFTDTSVFYLCDYPCMGTLESELRGDESAKNLTWKLRWYIALEIGGSLRYLHEESVEGPIAHLSVCSSSIVFSHGYSSMLGNFTSAKRLKGDVPCNEDSPAEDLNLEEEAKHISVDIRDYGMFLVELISGKSVSEFKAQADDGQTLVDWALPLLENNTLSKVMDSRLEDISDARVANYLARAALLCLKNISGDRLSMNEVLAVVRDDQFAMSKCSIP